MFNKNGNYNLNDIDLNNLNSPNPDASKFNSKNDTAIINDMMELDQQFIFIMKKRIKGLEKISESYKKGDYEESIAEAEKLSNFRVKIYSYVYEKMLKDIKEKKKPKALVYHLNEKNVVHLVPLSDNLQLVYGIDFLQKTDQSLARVFLQELKEAKNHVKNCIAGNVYVELAEVPKNIMDIDNPQNYSNGLVVFNLFVNKFDTIKKFLNYFVTFREYIQFHIHSIKTFLHIRMNRKGKELMNKLEGCKIIPENYIRHLESVQFYTNWNKKEENQKIFTDEVKKINV